jgi:predicted MFS family arabinose efflux permease
LFARVFAPFAESRDFRLMWAGACVSSIGTWMQKLAQSWLVLEISGSPFWLGVDAFLGESPIFLFAIVAGAVADRVDRRKLLLASQLVQMTCALILAALFATNVAQVWHILLLSFVVGTAQSFGAPAYQALLPSLVRKELLPNAIAMNSIQFNLARIMGPMLGGFALQNLGAAWCFGLNATSYLAVIYTLLAIRAGFLPAPTKESLLDSMKAGVRFIRRQPAMESLIVVAFLMTFLGLPILVYLPVFAKSVFRGGVGTFTLLQTIEGVGAIVGAILVASRSKRRNVGRDALLALIALGVIMTAFALSSDIWLSCALLFVGGIAIISCFALVNSLVQYAATDEMRGRVMSVYNIAFRGGGPVGSFLTGGLVDRVGVQPVVAVMGAVLSLMGVWLFAVHKKVARL